MAATFSTPIAAVIIAIELLLFEFKTRSFIPLCIASVIATGVRFALFGTGPMFRATPAGFGSLKVLPFYLILGIVAGLVGAFLTKALYFSEDVFDRVPLPVMWLPAIGGLGVGLLGYVSPRILGVGYDTITEILAGALPVGVLVSLVLAKSAALCVSLGSKTSGGVLAPLLMVGGAIGALYGIGAHRLFPALNIAPGVFALVCMAAVFAGSTRATFTSIVFAFELTRDYQAVLPLMFACVIADATASLLCEHSIMTEKLVRRGVKVPTEYEADVLGGMRVDDVMSSPTLTLPAATTIADLLSHISGRIAGEIAHQAYPIVDDAGALVGIVSRSDVMNLGDMDLETRTVGDLATKDLVVAFPDEALHEALAKMLTFDIGHLPVVRRGDPKAAVGFLTRSDILKARHRRMAEELQQEQVYRPHWPHRGMQNAK
jgi:CBS domain-containing protein